MASQDAINDETESEDYSEEETELMESSEREEGNISIGRHALCTCT